MPKRCSPMPMIPKEIAKNQGLRRLFPQLHGLEGGTRVGVAVRSLMPEEERAAEEAGEDDSDRGGRERGPSESGQRDHGPVGPGMTPAAPDGGVGERQRHSDREADRHRRHARERRAHERLVANEVIAAGGAAAITPAGTSIATTATTAPRRPPTR